MPYPQNGKALTATDFPTVHYSRVKLPPEKMDIILFLFKRLFNAKFEYKFGQKQIFNFTGGRIFQQQPALHSTHIMRSYIIPSVPCKSRFYMNCKRDTTNLLQYISPYLIANISAIK